MGYSAGSLNSGHLELGIALVLQDKFSNQAREASSQIRKLHNEAKSMIFSNIQSINQVNGLVGGIMDTAGSFLRDAIESGAEYIDTMTTVKAITSATSEEFDMLKQKSQGLAISTMFSSQDIASGMQYLAMAGNKAKDIQDIIQSATYVAGAAGMELGGKGGAADLLTNIMKTFQFEGKEAADVIGDQLVKAAHSSNVSIRDLALSVKYASADMVILKQSLPQVAAMVGTLGNSGIQGSMAGTSISNMARYLVQAIEQPNRKGHKVLVSLGLDPATLKDAQGNIKDFGNVLERVFLKIKDLGTVQQAAALNAIFGARGGRAAALIISHLQEYRDLLDQIQNNSQGYAEYVMEQRMETLAGGINQVKSTWENFKVSFAEALAPALTPILKGIAKIFDWLTKLMNVPVLGTIISIGATAGIVFGLIGTRLVMVRTRLLQAFASSSTSAKNMFAVLTSGWKSAEISALRYAQIQRNIMLNKANFVPTLAAANKAANNPITKVSFIGRNGQMQYRYRNATTGRFISAAQANALTSSGAASMSMAAAQATTSSRLMGGLTSVGTGLMGLFGGPLGLAIIGTSIALPLIDKAISAVNDNIAKNTLASVENTAALGTLASMMATERQRIEAGALLGKNEELALLREAINENTEALRNSGVNNNPVQQTIVPGRSNNGNAGGDSSAMAQ